MADTSVLEAERLRTILREAEDRFNHELLFQNPSQTHCFTICQYP